MNKKQLIVAWIICIPIFLFSICAQAEQLKYGEELWKEIFNQKQPNEVDISQIEIVTTNVWKSSRTNRISFLGELKNNSNKPIKNIKLQLTLYDKNNSIIDRRYEIFGNQIGFVLFPSETMPFEFMYGGELLEEIPQWNRYEITIIKAYEVEFEAKEAHREWKPEDLELIWHRIETRRISLDGDYIIKGEIKNNSIYDIDYPPAWIRIYAFDKDNKLSAVKIESICIPKKESKIFEISIGREIGQINSYKINFK